MSPGPSVKYKVRIKMIDHFEDAPWTVDGAPERFDTQEAAWKEIEDFIEDSRVAFRAGDLGSPYYRSDFEVVPDFAGAVFEECLRDVPRTK